MRKIFPILVPLLVCFIRVTVSAPLGVDIIDPDVDRPIHVNDKKRLEGARVEANKHIDNMHRVIKNPHHPAHQSIINEAFGPNPNLKKIGENVEQLRHGKISIEHLHHGNLGKGVYADTSERHRTVRLGSDFHWHHQNDESRAGTLIHEAAHALFDAHDHFSKGPNSKGLTTSEAHRAGREKLTGYTHSPDFETLKKDHSHLMHSNADSYKKFGKLAMDIRPLTNKELNAGFMRNPGGRGAGEIQYAAPHPVAATHTHPSGSRLPLPRPASPKRKSVSISPSRPADKHAPPRGPSLVRTKSPAGGNRHTAPGPASATRARPANPKHVIPPSRPPAKHASTSGRPPVRPKSPAPGGSRQAAPGPGAATRTRSSSGRLPPPRPATSQQRNGVKSPSRPASKAAPPQPPQVRPKSSAGGSRHTAPGPASATRARTSVGKLPLPRPANPKHGIPPSRPPAKHASTSGRPPVRPKSPAPGGSRQAAPGPGAATRTRSSSGKLPPPRPATPQQRNGVKSPSRPASKAAPPQPPQVRPKSSAGGSRHTAPGPVKATHARPSGGKPPLPSPASPKYKNGAPPSHEAAKSAPPRGPAPVRPKTPAASGNQKGRRK